jgi:sulfur-oxidizing protein SoxB
VSGGGVKDYRYKLIPVFSDAITGKKEVAAKIEAVRAPHARLLGDVIGRSETLLYRRGNFNGTFDDVICDALLAERDAEVALSPGFRWGNSLLPGQDITMEDVYNTTAISYPAAYRIAMSGARLREVLEDVADNLFNPDPYYQQGGDMVRVGGLSYTIDVSKPMGGRISDLKLTRGGTPVEPAKDYIVAGWASINEGTEGPPIWDVVANFIRRKRVVAPSDSTHVRVIGH